MWFCIPPPIQSLSTAAQKMVPIRQVADVSVKEALNFGPHVISYSFL